MDNSSIIFVNDKDSLTVARRELLGENGVVGLDLEHMPDNFEGEFSRFANHVYFVVLDFTETSVTVGRGAYAVVQLPDTAAVSERRKNFHFGPATVFASLP